MKKLINKYSVIIFMAIISLFIFYMPTISAYASAVIDSVSLMEFGPADNVDGEGFLGLKSQQTGILVLPENTPDGKPLEHIAIETEGGNIENITGLDISQCSHLKVIRRYSFSTAPNLAGSITFPASFTTLQSNAFANTKVTEYRFMGEFTSSISFTGAPSTLTKVVVPESSFQTLNSSSFTGTKTYWYYVSVNNEDTTLMKDYGDNFTAEDYEILSQGIENLNGFTVEGDNTVYNATNFSTLKCTNQNLIPVIEESVAEYNISYSSGKGYSVNGTDAVEDGNPLNFTVTINEYYDDSQFNIVIFDENSENVEYSKAQNGNVYTITVNNVSSNLTVSITGVVPNDFTLNINPSENLTVTTIDDVTLAADVSGDVNLSAITYVWSSEELIIENANESTLNLGLLTAGNYNIELSATLIVDGTQIIKTASVYIIVSDVKYNISYPQNQIGYTLTGTTNISANKDFSFDFSLNDYYSESDYIINVYNINGDIVFTTNNTSTCNIVENVSSDLRFEVENVVLNQLSIDHKLLNASDSEITEVAVGANVKLQTILTGNLPISNAKFTYTVNGNTNLSTTSVLNLENLSLGNYVVDMEVELTEINKTYTSEFTFEVVKRIIDVQLNLANKTFDNTALEVNYDVEYKNYCGEYEFTETYFVKDGSSYTEVNEIKNAGDYKVVLSYNSNEVTLFNESVFECEVKILPKEFNVYYQNKDYRFEFNGERQFPQIYPTSNALEYLNEIGLNANQVKEKLYVVNRNEKTLIYDLPAFSNFEDYNEFNEYLINAGNYYCEIYCTNENFSLTITNNQLLSVNYTILPKTFVITAQTANVYKESVENPEITYNLVVNDANNIKTPFVVTFNRESGEVAGRYDITSIKSFEVANFNVSNFVFELSSKTSHYYTITPKDVFVYWSDVREFVFDGEYHAPECYVADDFDGELVISVTGKQNLPNDKLGSYTAKATCTSKNFNLINSAAKFTINPTTLVSNQENGSVSIESDLGFNPNYSVVLENANTNNSSLNIMIKEKYDNVYSINGGYNLKVVDAEANEVLINENVTVNIKKPEYFERNMKVLQILPDGTTEEINYSTSGDYIVLNGVNVGSSFIFISPNEEENYVFVIIAASLTAVAGFGLGAWFIKRKRVNKVK